MTDNQNLHMVPGIQSSRITAPLEALLNLVQDIRDTAPDQPELGRSLFTRLELPSATLEEQVRLQGDLATLQIHFD